MWSVLIIAGIVLSVCYILMILLYLKWYSQLKPFKKIPGTEPATGFSIVIPARNEEKNIEQCIRSITANNYPPHLYEIIAVDDFSTDRTPAVVNELQSNFPQLRFVQLKDTVNSPINSYKKKAIETAINTASFGWIVTTDADCLVPVHWLRLFDAYIQKENPVFIAAPVRFDNTGTLLSIFQCLDFISLQGITAASVSAGFHSMCNGANLAYSKDAFYSVNGFKDADSIASGDDMLLMHKIKKQYPSQTGYLFSTDAIVTTKPEKDLQNFLNQRIRWASKATSYNDRRIFLVLLFVYVHNLILFLLPLTAFFNIVLLKYWFIFLAVKTTTELLFMMQVAAFFGQQKLLWWFPFMQPFHIAYTVISGWLGKFGSYQWKGRTVQ